jgi:hypothetical protein
MYLSRLTVTGFYEQPALVARKERSESRDFPNSISRGGAENAEKISVIDSLVVGESNGAGFFLTALHLPRFTFCDVSVTPYCHGFLRSTIHRFQSALIPFRANSRGKVM